VSVQTRRHIQILAPVALAVIVIATTAWMRFGRASGIPTSTPLFYAGTLHESGAPVTGQRAITLILWDSETETASANNQCQTTSPTTEISNGRFRIALDASCTDAVSANPDLWIEVIVGATSLGRKKLGAVPYAIEARAATTASGPLAAQLVPPGAVMFFNLAACPSGWTELVAARGRYVVGVPSGGTLAGTVGTALSNQENRAVGQHGHTVTDPGHNHGGSTGGVNNFPSSGAISHLIDHAGPGTTPAFHYTTTAGANPLQAHTHGIASGATGVQVNSAGAVAGTNAPYLQLRVCQKT
jgi:hypothetical protein